MSLSIINELQDILEQSISKGAARSIILTATQRSGLPQNGLGQSRCTEQFYEEILKGLRNYSSKPLSQLDCFVSLQSFRKEYIHQKPITQNLPTQSIRVYKENDVSRSCRLTQKFAIELGFDKLACQQMITVTAELTRNILQYADTGKIILSSLKPPEQGLQIEAIDQGPGIKDLDAIMAGTYQSKDGMGLGILGCQKLMDDFTLQTSAEKGTYIITKKYLAASWK